MLTLGTICHEIGHLVCDFPDLYDPGDDEFESHGVGGYCLMSHGASIDERNPTQICAYLKYRAGWASSVNTISAGLNTVKAGVNDFFIHPKNDSEYFIIENRQQAGRDTALPGSGLAIWHVDEDGDNERHHMTTGWHFECSLEQADGKFDLETIRHPRPPGHHLDAADHYGDVEDLYRSGVSTDFGDATTPDSRWWDGTPSGLEMSRVSASGVTMTFDSR